LHNCSGGEAASEGFATIFVEAIKSLLSALTEMEVPKLLTEVTMIGLEHSYLKEPEPCSP